MALATQLSLSNELELNKVLVVDADAEAISLVSGYIDKLFPQAGIMIAKSLQEAKSRIHSTQVDFLFLELDLPDSEGIQTLRELAPQTQMIPVLVYSHKDDSDLAIEAVKAGAQDYLVKGRGNAFTFKRIIQHSLERKRVIMESHRNEQMLNTFIKYAPAGIAVFDAQFRLLMASDRWCKDHRLVRQDAEGQSFSRIFKKADGRWSQMVEQCLRGEHIHCDEDQFVTNDGQEHYIRWEMMPWFDVSGEPGGIIQFTEFINEQRQIRMELEAAKSNLELKVKDRTQELASAVMMAQQASKAKEEFFANMTHELRTPLHAIINFSRFGMKKVETASTEKIHEYFSDINRSGERLLGLVNDLLNLTKHQAGKSEMDIKQESVVELVKAVSKEMSSIMEAKDLSFNSHISDTCQFALFDMRRLHQVLINLTSNAAKFSPEHTTITIEVLPSDHFSQLMHSGDDSREMVVFSVMDQGIGIPEDELNTVFDEFAQSKKVKSGEFSAGTGLGLAICKEIIQAHGGSIWAESNPEGGAILRFVIPKG